MASFSIPGERRKERIVGDPFGIGIVCVAAIGRGEFVAIKERKREREREREIGRGERERKEVVPCSTLA